MNFVFISARIQGLEQPYLEAVKSFLSHHHLVVESETSLSGNKARRLDLKAPSTFDPESVKTELVTLCDHHKTDHALIERELFLKKKKLFVFDMDSTLIQHEVIDEMAMVHGIGDQVKEITVRAMNGELNFDQSLTERVKLLKGLKKNLLQDISAKLTLMPGAEKLMKAAKKSGAKTVIASGGFSFFAEKILERLSMDAFYANTLAWDNDTLIGSVTGEVVNAEYKAALLVKLAGEEQLALSEVVAVGDGANDIPMLKKAGLGFAYHAKPRVRIEANHQLQHGPMETLLFFLNIPGDHFQ